MRPSGEKATPFDVRRPLASVRKTSAVVAVEMRLAPILRLVDGAGQEAARRIDAPIVEAAGALVLRVVGQLRLAIALGIEQPQAGTESCDEAAVLPQARCSRSPRAWP